MTTRLERDNAAKDAERAELNRFENKRMSKREQERQEAIAHLRTIIKPGDTVYTVLRHVSRSGMTRGIDVYIMGITDSYSHANCECRDCAVCQGSKTICGECHMCTRCHNHTPRCQGCKAFELTRTAEPVWITAYVGKAIDQPQPADYWRKSLGLKIGGCGMDMGFHVVNSLSYALYGEGYQCLGKGKCPSNYHVNHRDTVACEGTMVWNNDGPNTGERCRWTEGIGHAIDGKKCPKCKGKGRLPNPDGPERFDLMHTDGYALRHRWL